MRKLIASIVGWLGVTLLLIARKIDSEVIDGAIGKAILETEGNTLFWKSLYASRD